MALHHAKRGWGKHYLFTDYTAVYLTVSNESDSNTLQQDLDTLQTWKHLWDMDSNLYTSLNPAQHIYMLHGQELKAADHAKYLGVHISNGLCGIHTLTGSLQMPTGH